MLRERHFTFEKVPLVLVRRPHQRSLIPHDGLEGRLQRCSAVLVVNVELGEVPGLGRSSVTVSQGAQALQQGQAQE